MSTLQEALQDAGLAHTRGPVSGSRPAHTAPPEVPASVTMGQVQRHTAYATRRPAHFDLDGYALNPIGSSVNFRNEPQPATRFTLLGETKTYAKFGVTVTPEMQVAALQARTCSTCFTVIPRGFTACPDC